MNELNELVNSRREQLRGSSEGYSGMRVSRTCVSSSLQISVMQFPTPATDPMHASKAKDPNLLPLVIPMLVFAIFSLSLTILTVWRRAVALQQIRF